jgi:hypothetical protein
MEAGQQYRIFGFVAVQERGHRVTLERHAVGDSDLYQVLLQ